MVDPTGPLGVAGGSLGLAVAVASLRRRSVGRGAHLAAAGLAVVAVASLGLGVLDGSVPAPVLGALAAAFAATGVLSRSPE
ncbi:MAG: hypothetical protein ACLFMX_08340 [Halobacteriales archaeon]